MRRLILIKSATLVLTCSLLFSINSCKKKDPEPSNYAVALTEADEDFIDFGTFGSFTLNSDWAIIEKVKFTTGASSGWHFFRGKAWIDVEGDLAISIDENRVHAWVRSGGSWINVIYETTLSADRWYNICFQYTLATTTLDLYVDGVLRATESAISMDDANNTNKLFWGGQEASPGDGVGDLYSETSVTIANQAWYRRVLTQGEISSYNGTVNTGDSDLYFVSVISGSGVTDGSGHGHNGTNGNSPEFIRY
jgi:hypothetical protein